MWLGFSAAFVGMLYALVKFAAAFDLRRLRERLAQIQYELRKVELRIEAVEERLELERSKKRTLQHETDRLRERVEKRYIRLRALLPSGLLSRLERCRTMRVEPSGGDLKRLQELDLLGEIDKALGSISLLFVRLPEETDAALGALIDRLKAERVRFHGPEEEVVVALFPHPRKAVDFFRRFLGGTPKETTAKVRAALYSGMEIRGEESVIRRLLVSSFRKGRRLLEQAPPGCLLMNEEAHQALADPRIRPFEVEGTAYGFSWSKEGETPCSSLST